MMLGGIRLWLYAALGLVFLAALARYSYVVKELKQQRRDNAQLELRLATADAQVEAEQKARKHEQEIANAASNGFQTKVTELQAELASRPLKPVVIRLPARTSLPQASGSTGAAGGSDAETQGREHGEAEADITAELTAGWLDCQKNTAQLEALQSWVLAR